MENVEKWVNTLNAIDYALIENSVKNNIDDWVELTKPIVGDYDGNTGSVIESIDAYNETYMVEDDDEEYDLYDAYVDCDSFLPMWGTMWTFNNRYEENWVRNNLYEVSEMGFRIYEYQETGTLYIGIDGAGYDFYEAHWNKLYNALYNNK